MVIWITHPAAVRGTVNLIMIEKQPLATYFWDNILDLAKQHLVMLYVCYELDGPTFLR